MADEAYERVLAVKNEVFVYQIPARTTNRGYRAADWKLDNPDWTGRMRVVAKGKDLYLKMEDKISGELFAQSTIDGYPGTAMEQVLDSSRYFVLRIQDGSGRSAFVGIGFQDRSDSFDLIVTIQDHFKWIKREEAGEKEEAVPFDSGPQLDLGFKEGQTIRINIGAKSGTPKARPKPSAGGGMGILPPPPGGVKLAGPPRGIPAANPIVPPPISSVPNPQAQVQPSNNDLLGMDFGGSSNVGTTQPAVKQGGGDPWGDFAGASSGSSASSSSGNDWVQF